MVRAALKIKKKEAGPIGQPLSSVFEKMF